mgnify:CR=1 FL=1
MLQGEELISLTKASGLMRAQLSANGQSYNEILKSTKASLIDLIRIADDRFALVGRPHGPQTGTSSLSSRGVGEIWKPRSRRLSPPMVKAQESLSHTPSHHDDSSGRGQRQALYGQCHS